MKLGLDYLRAVFHDQAALIALSKNARAELEDILQGDAQLNLTTASESKATGSKTVPDTAP